MHDLYARSTGLQATGSRVVTLNSTTPFTPSLVRSSLGQVSDPEQIYASRIQGRQIPLENPARVSKAKQKLERKKQARKKEGKKKWARSSEVKLDDCEAKYDKFVPLHQLWMGYMSELLGQQTSSMQARLVKADLHGSMMTVRASKNVCLVGLAGIVIYESENAFRIITKADKLKLVPKQNTTFAFAVPDASSASRLTEKETVLDRAHIEFELYGNQFRFRAADRASRKFKHKETIEL